jgi:hypothetical protein
LVRRERRVLDIAVDAVDHRNVLEETMVERLRVRKGVAARRAFVGGEDLGRTAADPGRTPIRGALTRRHDEVQGDQVRATFERIDVVKVTSS